MNDDEYKKILLFAGVLLSIASIGFLVLLLFVWNLIFGI